MYQVIQQGIVIRNFKLFIDAWLFVTLELPTWASVHGDDEEWHFDPISPWIH
jgi:hypothetical protein